MHVHLLQETPDLLISIMILVVIRQANLLFFDGADKPLGVTVLPSGAHFSHAYGAAHHLQPLYVVDRSILLALV
jgi:hypothetical protein